MSGKHCWHISLFAYWPLMKLCSSDGKWSVIRDDKCLYEASHQVRLCVIAQDQVSLCTSHMCVCVSVCCRDRERKSAACLHSHPLPFCHSASLVERFYAKGVFTIHQGIW